MLNVPLHVEPVEAFPCQVQNSIRSETAPFLVEFPVNKAVEFLRKNYLIGLTICTYAVGLRQSLR